MDSERLVSRYMEPRKVTRKDRHLALVCAIICDRFWDLRENVALSSMLSMWSFTHHGFPLVLCSGLCFLFFSVAQTHVMTLVSYLINCQIIKQAKRGSILITSLKFYG